MTDNIVKCSPPYPEEVTDKLCTDIYRYIHRKMKKYPLLAWNYSQWDPMNVILDKAMEETNAYRRMVSVKTSGKVFFPEKIE